MTQRKKKGEMTRQPMVGTGWLAPGLHSAADKAAMSLVTANTVRVETLLP
jgi:hypothetical protein